MLHKLYAFFNPTTASVLTKITSMIDALDNVHVKHSAKAARHMEASSYAKAQAMIAHQEATIAKTAATKISAAFGVER